MRTYRKLWRTYPGIHRLSRAQSLEAYSQRLFGVCRPTEGCSALSEIVDMGALRQISRDAPPESGRITFGYAYGLVNAGPVAEACTATREVVDVYRKKPATYHAHLGHALDGHANRLNIAERDAKA